MADGHLGADRFLFTSESVGEGHPGTRWIHYECVPVCVCVCVYVCVHKIPIHSIMGQEKKSGEVSLFQRLIYTQLGPQKLSSLERCPFREVPLYFNLAHSSI